MNGFRIQFEEDVPVDYSPNSMLIYGMSKIGKTDNLLQLKKALILDFKKGATLLTAMNGSKKVVPRNLEDIQMLCEDNRNASEKDKFNFLVIDDVTTLVKMIETRAKELYIHNLTDKERAEAGFSKPGSAAYNEAFKKLNLEQTPWGKGVKSKLPAYSETIDMMKDSFRKVIIIGHPTGKAEGIDTNIFDVAELDIPNKDIKEEVIRYTDQLCIMTRPKGTRTNVLDFSQSGENMKLGGRTFLDGKKVVISEKDDDDVVTTFWHRVYPDMYGISKEDAIKESKTWASAAAINTKVKSESKPSNDDI